MKKNVLISGLLLFCFSVCAANAVEVTLLGPKQYLRTKKNPTIYSNTFPGRIGQGTLAIKNGAQSGANRIDSGTIKVNGVQIFGVKNFSLDVYTLEAPVNLLENNTIYVELRSAVGSYLTIEIKEVIDIDGAGVIGGLGGTVEVMDSNSPLHGLKINIPSGALSNPTIISVSTATNMPDPPSYVTSTSTSFDLLPDGLVFDPDYPVEVTVPYSFANTGPDDFVFVMRHDEQFSDWRHVGQLWIDKTNNKLGIQISHFSLHQVMLSTPILRYPVDIGFSFDNDKFPSDLVGDFCKGEAAYTNWYWRAKGSGLKCAYSKTRAANIQSQSQSALSNIFSPYYNWTGGRFGQGENEESVANKLWQMLVGESKPQLLVLKENSSPFCFAHTVVIYKYEYNGALNRGYFYLMDPNYTGGPEKLTYDLSSKDILDFAGSSGTYKLFQYKQWDPNTNSILQNVYDQNPIDGVPCPARLDLFLFLSLIISRMRT